MSDAPADPAPSLPGSTPVPTARPRRLGWRWQLGLRGLILLVVAAALGFSIAADRRQIADLTRRVDRLRAMIGELEVADPTQPAAMLTNEHWMKSLTWEVDLPPGPQYRLVLATREIDNNDQFPQPLKSAPLAPGRYCLTASHDWQVKNHVLKVQSGRTTVLDAQELPTWAGTGMQVRHVLNPTHRDVGRTIQRPVGRPLPLLRRRFGRPVPGNTTGAWETPDGPRDGVLLWIESQPAGPTP